MPLKQELLTGSDAARALQLKITEKRRFVEATKRARMQRLAQSAKRGILTNRERAFIARQKVAVPRPVTKQITGAQPAQPSSSRGGSAPAQHPVDKYFEKIFVLNMKRRLDRWYATKHRLDRVGIKNYERFIAIDGTTSPYAEQYAEYAKKPYNVYDKKYGRKAIRSAGVWGILKSTLKMIAIAKQRGYKNFLVFQDDVMFHHNFTKLFAEKIKKIPQDWKLCYLGITQVTFSREMNMAKDYYNPAGRGDGAFAVAIHESVYDDIIRQISSYVLPLDTGAMMYVQRKYLDKCVVIKPFLTIADTNESDCRAGRETAEFSKTVSWNYKDYEEYSKMPVLPLISVIMVTQNNGKYVEDAIVSLLYQTYRNIELIILDNNSTDNTVQVINKIKQQVPQIKLVQSQRDMPASVYYNMGLLLATGHAVMFHSPVFKSLTTRLEQQVSQLRKNNAVVTCGYRIKNGVIEQSIMSAIYSKRAVAEAGYMECVEDGAEYEYFEKIRRLRYPVAKVEEIYYIPYLALAENLEDDSEEIIPERPERLQEITTYHDFLMKQPGPKYRAFPAKKATEGQFAVDVDYVTALLENIQ